MKTLKNIIAFIMIMVLIVIYMIDRTVLVLLPWTQVTPLQNWLPKHIDAEKVKTEFPTLSNEAIDEIIEGRKFTNKLIKVSFLRVFIVAFIAMSVYLIWM